MAEANEEERPEKNAASVRSEKSYEEDAEQSFNIQLSDIRNLQTIFECVEKSSRHEEIHTSNLCR